MTSPDYEELKNYLNGHKKSSFIKSINDNIDMLPMWSTEDNAYTGPALFSIWYERYKQAYGEFNENSKNLKKPQYNCLIWNSERRRLLKPGTTTSYYADSGKIAAYENAQVIDEANQDDSSSNINRKS
ncbi:hypothetical protein BDF21DRAFT_491654 [Thamnidium elegans]|uniref:Uncharacterized protein n=1 Tax=Thamnidium elegans TaxID=101142 RepID=A0A8H7STN9_9FUNG|nr:hypothetical protein INT48_009766 [Thamnidium elegans]KAI8087125.1 hypothetical protein BDF21DRAFT_491654 [Thamnidium elegans]